MGSFFFGQHRGRNGAAALVAIFDYLLIVGTDKESVSTTIFVILGVVIGSITFTGSIIASGKLQGLISGQPIRVPGGVYTTIGLGIVALITTVLLVMTLFLVVTPIAGSRLLMP